jgi:hypothetical protein
MLGEKLGEERGKVTGRRVLPGDDYRYSKMEITYETEGTLLGLKGANIGTYTVYERVPGQLFGEGRGIVMLETGESAIWSGQGSGTPKGDGMGVKFAAALTFQASGSGKLSALNNVLVVIEHETAGDGSAHSTLFEWKA